MKYLSLCSGIEAATVAWATLGWRAVAYSEIEPFPCAVLAHHYPHVPNWGDMTKFREWPDGAIDLLAGGTPCQSFSVAGLRAGLADPRGSLMLTFGAVADRYRPRWLVWENVPGVLSSNGGRDFGTFLGMLGQLGYGFAYRILDAQYFGLAQHRRRVFVVGYLGDWRPAAAVLFERQSLRGDPAPGRETGESVAAFTANGVGTCGADDNQGQAGHLIAFGGNNTSGTDDLAAALNGHGGGSRRLDFESETFITHALRGEGFDASEDGTGRGGPLVPVAFNSREDPCVTGKVAGALGASMPQAQAIAFNLRGRDGGAQAEVDDAGLANIRAASGGSSRTYVSAAAVRRLTPRECERLQGFPDDYTLIPYRGRMAADGPRYKALGNSMAVPVMRWIGQRIMVVEDLKRQVAA